METGRVWAILRRAVRRNLNPMVHHEIKNFLQESPSLRRAALTSKMWSLRDRHDDLLADHARMVHASDSGAKLLAQALCKNLKSLDALGWQLREEAKALDALSEVWESRDYRGIR